MRLRRLAPLALLLGVASVVGFAPPAQAPVVRPAAAAGPPLVAADPALAAVAPRGDRSSRSRPSDPMPYALRGVTAAPAAPVAKAKPVAVPVRSGSGKRIVYSVPLQRVWLVGADGKADRTYLVSGQLSQPDAGAYRVYSKSRHATSGVSAETMQYMVRFAYGERTGTPIGFHDIPRRANGTYSQTVAQLGRPLSHGCVRQSSADAKVLWSFADVGTKVVVVR